jgi:hypothetical protein
MAYQPIRTEFGHRLGTRTGLDAVKRETSQSVPEIEFLAGKNSNKRSDQ